MTSFAPALLLMMMKFNYLNLILAKEEIILKFSLKRCYKRIFLFQNAKNCVMMLSLSPLPSKYDDGNE